MLPKLFNWNPQQQRINTRCIMSQNKSATMTILFSLMINELCPILQNLHFCNIRILFKNIELYFTPVLQEGTLPCRKWAFPIFGIMDLEAGHEGNS